MKLQAVLTRGSILYSAPHGVSISYFAYTPCINGSKSVAAKRGTRYGDALGSYDTCGPQTEVPVQYRSISSIATQDMGTKGPDSQFLKLQVPKPRSVYRLLNLKPKRLGILNGLSNKPQKPDIVDGF